MSDDIFRANRSFSDIAAEIESMAEPRVIKTRAAARAHHFRLEHRKVAVRIVVVVDSQEEAERAAPYVLAMPGDREIESKVALRPVLLPGAMREDGTDEPEVEIDLAAPKAWAQMTAAEQRALPSNLRPITIRLAARGRQP